MDIVMAGALLVAVVLSVLFVLLLRRVARHAMDGQVALGLLFLLPFAVPLAFRLWDQIPAQEVVDCKTTTHSRGRTTLLTLADRRTVALDYANSDADGQCPRIGSTVEKRRGEIGLHLNGGPVSTTMTAIFLDGAFMSLGASFLVGWLVSRLRRKRL